MAKKRASEVSQQPNAHSAEQPLVSRAPPGTKAVAADEAALLPEAQGAAAIESWSTHFGKTDPSSLFKLLSKEIDAVSKGDMRPIEAMLLSQSHVLANIFTHLSRRAASAEFLHQFQANMSLALKAQAQCRCTLEALAEVRNPRQGVAFVKQANISAGYQQVNNAVTPSLSARAEKSRTAQNELMSHDHERSLDCRTQSTTGGANQALAAVEAINGATDSGRKGSRVAECLDGGPSDADARASPSGER